MAGRFPRCVAFAALLAAGCADAESVRVLDEPKPDRPAASVPPGQRQFRTLAAMVPADTPEDGGQNWWFFKLSGPVAVIDRYEADFNKLIDTVRTGPDGDDPVSWTAPPGWTQPPQGKGSSSMRYATLKSPEGAAEVAVSRAGGIVLGNVRRWWGQLWGKDKEQEVTAANLPGHVRQRLVNGRLVLQVDFAGPKDPNANLPKMVNPHGGN